MIVGFFLSMPSNNSWNGKWSGEGKLYARVLRTRRKSGSALHMAVQRGSFYYNFGDGWAACVNVREIGRADAAMIRRKSQGFCGYDWMIDSILTHGKIQVDKVGATS